VKVNGIGNGRCDLVELTIMFGTCETQVRLCNFSVTPSPREALQPVHRPSHLELLFIVTLPSSDF
jgi:hypothetical protein